MLSTGQNDLPQFYWGFSDSNERCSGFIVPTFGPLSLFLAAALNSHICAPDRVRAAQRSGWPDVFGSVLARLCGAFGEPY
jgi:hypothetical protein